jgi:hypothetical protein
LTLFTICRDSHIGLRDSRWSLTPIQSFCCSLPRFPTEPSTYCRLGASANVQKYSGCIASASQYAESRRVSRKTRGRLPKTQRVFVYFTYMAFIISTRSMV